MHDCNAPRSVAMMSILAVVVAVAQGCAKPARYGSPQEAADALVQAAGDPSSAQLKKVLGSHADDLLSSGDKVADENGRQKFLDAYKLKHSLQPQGDGAMTLVVGAKDWPMPIPIVKDDKANTWYFDTDAGKDEIINRRVGRNETEAVQVCLAIVDAQREYVTKGYGGPGIPAYAQKFISHPGQKNGLYFETKEGEDPSPLGPLVAEATDEGYTAPIIHGKPQPYHGYRYRILKAQGPHATGGAHDYVVGGRMIGGFAVVAWPAEYGNSGVMTFIVNQEGVVYQKDLGDHAAAERMSAYDPDEGWKKAE